MCKLEIYCSCNTFLIVKIQKETKNIDWSLIENDRFSWKKLSSFPPGACLEWNKLAAAVVWKAAPLSADEETTRSSVPDLAALWRPHRPSLPNDKVECAEKPLSVHCCGTGETSCSSAAPEPRDGRIDGPSLQRFWLWLWSKVRAADSI